MNIPFGGQTVGIEIPDFALEATQRDIYDISRDQLSAMQSIASEISSQGDSLTRISRDSGASSTRPVVETLKQNDKKEDSRSKKLLNGFNAFQGAFDEEKASKLISNVFNMVPNGAIVGAALGTVFSILEKFGEAMSKTARVGVGLSSTFEEMKESAASVGVSFDQFAAIIASNGEMVRTLGSNVEDGAFALTDLTRRFQQATYQQGQYGMGNDEIMQLMLEEAEVRRVTTGQLYLDNQARQTLADSVAENIKQNTALARITGQDVRERMAARRAVEQNAIAQSYLTGQTDQVRERLGRFAETLAGMPAGNEITNAMINAIATGTDFRRFQPELFARMGQPAEDLFAFLQSAVQNGSMSMADFDSQLLSLTGGLANAASGQEEILRLQASSGNSAALELLAMQNQFREFGSVEEIREAYLENRRMIEEGGNLTVAGLNGAMDRLTGSINDAATSLVMSLIPGEAGSAGALLVAGITQLAEAVIAGTSYLEMPFNALRNLMPEGLFELDPRDLFPDPDLPSADSTDPTPTAATEPTAADPTAPIPVALDPADLRNAFTDALNSLFQNGSMPVDVRNFRDMPSTRLPNSTTA